MNTKLLFFLCLAPLLMACKGSQSSGDAPAIDSALVCKVQFDADSAFHFVKEQCDFGARTSNSTAIERCGDYIVAKFRSYGLDITEQKTTLKGWDGTSLRCRNIIAAYKPEAKDRLVIAAH